MTETRPMSGQGDTVQTQGDTVQMEAEASEPMAQVPRAKRPSNAQILKRLRLGGAYLSDAGRPPRSIAGGAALALPSWRELRQSTPLMILLAAALLVAFALLFLALQGSASSTKTGAEIRIEKREAAKEQAAAPLAGKGEKERKKDDPAASDEASSAQPQPAKPTGARPVGGQPTSSPSVVGEPAPSEPAAAPAAAPAPQPAPQPDPGSGTTTTTTTP